MERTTAPSGSVASTSFVALWRRSGSISARFAPVGSPSHGAQRDQPSWSRSSARWPCLANSEMTVDFPVPDMPVIRAIIVVLSCDECLVLAHGPSFRFRVHLRPSLLRVPIPALIARAEHRSLRTSDTGRSERALHHHPPLTWSTHFAKTSRFKCVPAADMKFSPCDLLPGRRYYGIALQNVCASASGVFDRCPGQSVADPLAPELFADDETCRCPNSVIGLILGAALPGRLAKPDICAPRLDGTPAHGLFRKIGDQSARSPCIGVAALRLGPETFRTEAGRKAVRIPFPTWRLETLAPTSSVIAARREYELEIVPTGSVCWADPKRCSVCHSEAVFSRSREH